MKRRLFVIGLVLVLAASLFATPTEEVPAETPVVRFFRPGIPDNWAEDPVILHINEALGIDLQIVTAGWGDYTQKINLILATGEPMDICSLVGDSRWVNEGAVMALDNYIDPERHPYIQMVTDAQMFAPVVYVDGKKYFIPGPNNGSDWSMVVRQDWLDELGMEAPTNGAEFYELLNAFKDMDDTGSVVPWAIEGGSGVRRGIEPLLLTFGVPTSEGDQKEDFIVGPDGTLESILFMDELKAALRFANQLYNEGLINSDFPSLSGYPPLTEKYIRTGLTGFFWAGNPMSEEKYILEVEPNAELAYVDPWSHDAAAGYEFTRARGGLANTPHAIASASEDPVLALDVIEYLNTKEGRMTTITGVEGVHWENLDESTGYYTRLPAYTEQWDGQSATGYHFYFGTGSMKAYIPYWDYDNFDEAYGHIQVVEARDRAGKLSIIEALGNSQNWIEGPHPFKFGRPPALHDESSPYYLSRGDVSSAIVEGWTKVIAGTEADFEKNWQAYVDIMDDAGWQTWQEQWQLFYDENY
jgi:ABC-type glycerol-3-phosphate transport system substrate-binding protein